MAVIIIGPIGDRGQSYQKVLSACCSLIISRNTKLIIDPHAQNTYADVGEDFRATQKIKTQTRLKNNFIVREFH